MIPHYNNSIIELEVKAFANYLLKNYDVVKVRTIKGKWVTRFRHNNGLKPLMTLNAVYKEYLTSP